MRDTLSKAEATVLLELARHDRLPSSSLVARNVYNVATEAPYHRGKVLNHLARLERRGFIERNDNGGWQGGMLTQLGRTRVTVESLFPIGDRPPRQHREPPIPWKAVADGRSNHSKTLCDPEPGLLKPGRNNVKLGWMVQKGALRGYAIYSLTLEERATCPRTCHRWDDCFGNGMAFAKRYKHGPELEEALGRELYLLLHNVRNRRANGPRGILVRLHVLGDFYDEHYVRFWNNALLSYPELSIFGYTARLPGFSTIGDMIRTMNENWSDWHWPRCRIRFSGGRGPRDTALWHAPGTAPDPKAFACPEQTGKTRSCATCAACWQGDKPVSFELH